MDALAEALRHAHGLVDRPQEEATLSAIAWGIIALGERLDALIDVLAAAHDVDPDLVRRGV